MIRLVLTILLFLTSLLSVTKAPAYHLWLLSVAVAGLPWLFAGIALALLVAISLWGSYYLAEGPLAAAAFGFFSWSILRTYGLSGRLKRQLPAEFSPSDGCGKPFSFRRMFSGPLEKKVPYRRFTYYSDGNISLDLDLYPSQSKIRGPCILVIHGGSWSSGSSRDLPELNSRLAKAGYPVAAINYRLAPRYRFPAPVEDVRNALKFLRGEASCLLPAVENFVLLGRSAGGQVALQAAYTLNDPGITGVIAFYAPADMVWGYSAPASPLIMDSRKVMEDYLGGTYEATPETYREASPVESVSGDAVPTLLIHGKKDVLVSYGHSTRLREKLRQKGVRHYLLGLPAGTHGFDYVLDGPEGQLAVFAIMHFLRQLTGKGRRA